MVITRKMLKNGDKYLKRQQIPYEGCIRKEIRKIKTMNQNNIHQVQKYLTMIKEINQIIQQRRIKELQLTEDAMYRYNKLKQSDKEMGLNPNNKHMMIKDAEYPIKIGKKLKHFIIKYYGDHSHFRTDIVPKITKKFYKYPIFYTHPSIEYQTQIPYINIILPNHWNC